MRERIFLMSKMLPLIAGGILAGTFLLVLVYCISIERIFYNFSVGVEGMNRHPGWY